MISSQRRRRAGTKADAPLAPIQFRLEAREEEVATAEGRCLNGRGYLICDPRTGAPLGEDDFFFRIGGGIVCDLSGAEEHLEELQSAAFRPGRSLSLVRAGDDGADDAPLIEVWDGAGATKVGALPSEVAEAVSFYGADSYEAAFCLWEWRTESGQRFALRLLLAPGWTVEQLPERDAATG
ncbi:MAG: hypothetical protein JOZ41_07170 [Chloroflexi bacterium]|nr:hypothetical protein [Chloroflexota bacterium]